MNTANKITMIRVVLVPIFMVLFMIDNVTCHYAALGVFVLASITDAIDGHVARKYNQVTTFGKFVEQEKPDTFAESKQVARRGGNVAGVARRETERELGHSVVSGQNFLDRNPDGLIEDTIGLPPLDSEKE